MTKILCKKTFRSFREGEVYLYYTNFGGLNHFVKNGNIIEDFRIEVKKVYSNPYLWDYFYTIEETRDILINSLIEL
jgi:hypothetical protein